MIPRQLYVAHRCDEYRRFMHSGSDGPECVYQKAPAECCGTDVWVRPATTEGRRVVCWRCRNRELGAA